MKKILPDNFRYPNYLSEIKFKNELPKKHSTCILVLSFNEIENVKKLALYLSKKINLLDVCFIDNHSEDGTFEFLNQNYSDIFNVLQTKENLGGAGGFCVGQEWVIERDYEYCILAEADCQPIDEDLIECLLEYRDKKCVVQSMYYEQNCSSFNFHFTLYPVELFKKAGVVNKNLFFRADDWEWGKRLEKVIKKEGYTCKLINKFYSHPIFKKGFRIGVNYFHFRNGLLVYAKRPQKNSFFDVSKNFLQYSWYSTFSFFNDKNITILKQFFFAFLDFLKGDFSRNREMLEKFKKEELKPKEKIKILEEDFSSFFSKYKNYSIASLLIKTNPRLRSYLQSSFFYSKAISSKFSFSNRLLAFFFKEIVFVEEIDFLNEKIYYFVYKNENFLKSWFFLSISAIFSVILYFVLLPAILFTILRLKLE
jgi:GT2 family glycosyltransferase